MRAREFLAEDAGECARFEGTEEVDGSGVAHGVLGPREGGDAVGCVEGVACLVDVVDSC